jgi:hypothetical protein
MAMPDVLKPEQVRVAVEVMKEYLAAPQNPDGSTPEHVQAARDVRRVEIIDGTLKPLLRSYLRGDTPLAEFKTKVDGVNKRHEYWGFKGIKGQMFFNMLVNVAEDPAECDHELKAALTLPTSEEIASSRMRTFAAYVKRLGERWEETGGSKAGRPKPGSVPFFVSYFWQVEDREVWPVYYTNSVQTMQDLNLWQPTSEPGADYLAYKWVHEQLAREFSRESGRPFDLYWVEHVFWFKGGNPYGGSKPLKVDEATGGGATGAERLSTGGVAKLAVQRREAGHDGPITSADRVAIERLPEGFVPPVISALERMAYNEPDMQRAAEASGISLERAFEKSVNAAFTDLGYDAKLLGQGKGRVPDGQAMDQDDSYAILWDAKIRTNGYGIGTDDRTIKEYITLFARDLKRRRGLRNIYYLIISGEFSGDHDDTVRMIKMETDVSEVCLVEAAALVEIVDARLRAPLQVSLGPDGVQRLLAVSGIVTPEIVRENLVGL